MKIFLALFLLCFSSSFAAQTESRVVVGGTIYRTFVAQPDDVQLYWQGENGKPLRQFSAVQAYLKRQGLRPVLLLNGGIFEDGGIPSGLLVSEGKVQHPLNLSDAPGNFFFKPNGVFYVAAGKAEVVSSEEYAKATPKARIAVQSGPLLLRNGQIHPGFKQKSTSYLHRNGVGIRKDGSALFAITEFGQDRYANLYEFAEFFRSQGCENALFLDGDISQMITNPQAPIAPGTYFGSIIAVTEPIH
ncbi:hypothetical protein BH09VER1_BH09VER1_20180 [soil metagenome]